jgi:hypothetical protein
MRGTSGLDARTRVVFQVIDADAGNLTLDGPEAGVDEGVVHAAHRARAGGGHDLSPMLLGAGLSGVVPMSEI